MKKCTNLDALGDKAYDLNLSHANSVGNKDSNQRKLEEYSEYSNSKKTSNRESG